MIAPAVTNAARTLHAVWLALGWLLLAPGTLAQSRPAASAPAATSREALRGAWSFPIACHDHMVRQAPQRLVEEITRLEAWLTRGHGQLLPVDPLQIERFHDLSEADGGPAAPAIRWLPHWVRPDRTDPGRWSLPISRINSVAVPVFTPAELLAAPPGPSARLLELVPVATFEGRAVGADLVHAWSKNGRGAQGGLAESAGTRVVVADGFVVDAPCDEHPGRCSDALARCRAQLDEERRLAQPAVARNAAHRFVPFDLLAGWDATAGLRAAPARVAQLDGVPVVMVGRILPIDSVDRMPSFLLVRDLIRGDWGRPLCLDRTVRVEMPAGEGFGWTEDPVRVAGILRVRETREDGFLTGVYTLVAQTAVRIDPGR